MPVREFEAVKGALGGEVAEDAFAELSGFAEISTVSEQIRRLPCAQDVAFGKELFDEAVLDLAGPRLDRKSVV